MEHHDFEADPVEPDWCAHADCGEDAGSAIHLPVEECDGYCDAAESYLIEQTVTVQFRVQAHSMEEADQVASSVECISYEEPSEIDYDGFDVDGPEWTVQNEREAAAERARWHAAYVEQQQPA